MYYKQELSDVNCKMRLRLKEAIRIVLKFRWHTLKEVYGTPVEKHTV